MNLQLKMFMGEGARVVWPVAEVYLSDTFNRPESNLTILDVKERIFGDLAQIWVIAEDEDIQAMFITQMSEESQGRVLEIIGLAGQKHQNWLHFIDTVELFARSHDAVKLRLYGRQGWVKLLKNYGFDRTIAVVEKSIVTRH